MCIHVYYGGLQQKRSGKQKNADFYLWIVAIRVSYFWTGKTNISYHTNISFTHFHLLLNVPFLPLDHKVSCKFDFMKNLLKKDEM